MSGSPQQPRALQRDAEAAVEACTTGDVGVLRALLASNGGAIVGAVLSTIEAQRLPTNDQIQLASFGAIASQLGRALGPVVATWIFQSAEERTGWSRGAGANFSRIYMLFVGSFPVTLALIGKFHAIFGSFSDPSPMERRMGQGAPSVMA